MATAQPKRARFFSAIAGTRRIIQRSVEKVKKLQALPAWTFPTQHVTWAEMFTAVQAWSKKEKQLPEAHLHVQAKKKWLPVGYWFAQQRKSLDDDGAQTDKQKQTDRQTD